MSNDMQAEADIDLLMIGKTGYGKSALGNSILNRKAFESKNSTSSVTKDVAYEFGEHDGLKIKVVDGPGVGDTRLDNEEALNLVMVAIQYAISANPRGYHAFLLVFKFGGRFTAEDKDTIEFLKKIFGESFIQNFCIIVMTFGDTFERQSEEMGETFEQWCAEQDGGFQDLLRECDRRIILFDNSSKDQDKRVLQVSKLIKMVQHMSSTGNRYTDEHFIKAIFARERIMIEAKKPMIKEETMQETSLILYKLQVVQNTIEPENWIVHLDELFIRAETLYDKISGQDNGTGALHDLVQTVKSIENTVLNEIKFSQRIISEKEKIRKQEEERERKFKEELKRQMDDYEQSKKKESIDEKRGQEMHERGMRELQERRKERQDEEFFLYNMIEREREKQRRDYEELERRYNAVKAENDKWIIHKIFDSLTGLLG